MLLSTVYFVIRPLRSPKKNSSFMLHSLILYARWKPTWFWHLFNSSASRLSHKRSTTCANLTSKKLKGQESYSLLIFSLFPFNPSPLFLVYNFLKNHTPPEPSYPFPFTLSKYKIPYFSLILSLRYIFVTYIYL